MVMYFVQIVNVKLTYTFSHQTFKVHVIEYV